MRCYGLLHYIRELNSIFRAHGRTIQARQTLVSHNRIKMITAIEANHQGTILQAEE